VHRIHPRIAYLAAALIAAALSLPGCLVRHRVVPSPGKPENRPLLTATREQLIDRIHDITDPVRSFSLRADMSPSVGSVNGGELTDYATVRAIILFQRPEDIRILGLDPVVHSKTIFDMVSAGRTFKVSIPSRDTFYIGDNEAPPSSKNKLENLRPEAFLTSLIIRPPADPAHTVMVDNTDETRAEYALLMMHDDNGKLVLSRVVYFDRYTLHITRQRTYDNTGGIVSDTRYSDWKLEKGVIFPYTITIRRPKDGYEVTVTVIAAQFNATLTADQFTLEQPAGSKVIEIK
jgi:hypothetical protein